MAASALARVTQPLEQAARAVGAPPAAVALAAALAQPFADVVFSGAASRGTLASNLAAVPLQLPDDVLEALTMLEEDSRRYCSRRAALAWN